MDQRLEVSPQRLVERRSDNAAPIPLSTELSMRMRGWVREEGREEGKWVRWEEVGRGGLCSFLGSV